MSVSKLREGDYCPNGEGAFQQVSGAEELLERVLFKLSVRRGSFPLLLPREKPSAREALAASYAAEALAGEAVNVLRAQWQEETKQLTVWLEWMGETLTTTLTL